MARTTPEKLAQALRANLRRRKAAPAAQEPAEVSQEARKAPETPVEKSRNGPLPEGD